jgi:hypothetical protein
LQRDIKLAALWDRARPGSGLLRRTRECHDTLHVEVENIHFVESVVEYTHFMCDFMGFRFM